MRVPDLPFHKMDFGARTGPMIFGGVVLFAKIVNNAF